MALNFFEKMVRKARASGIKKMTSASMKFFRNQVKALGSPKAGEILRTSKRKRQFTSVGRLYFYRYDPAGKKTLPYYDRFPLVFPIDAGRKSFLGLNMHYLPPVLRAKFLDQLTSIANNKKFDKTTKLRLSYDLLNSSKKFKLFRPTIKRYLNSQVRSAFVEITAEFWQLAIFLPVADFRKASQSKVWADSRKKIN